MFVFFEIIVFLSYFQMGNICVRSFVQALTMRHLGIPFSFKIFPFFGPVVEMKDPRSAWNDALVFLGCAVPTSVISVPLSLVAASTDSEFLCVLSD